MGVLTLSEKIQMIMTGCGIAIGNTTGITLLPARPRLILAGGGAGLTIEEQGWQCHHLRMKTCLGLVLLSRDGQFRRGQLGGHQQTLLPPQIR